MSDIQNPLLILGEAMALALIAGKLVERLRLPMVTGYALCGVILGISVARLFTEEMLDRVSLINDVTLGMIAFVIGGSLHWKTLRKLGKSVVGIATCEAILAAILTTLICGLWSGDWPLAIVLGAVASATAPAATVAIIQQTRAKGTLTSTLLAVVGLDDAIAFILYGFAAAIATSMVLGEEGGAIAWGEVLIAPIRDLGLSLLVGMGLGAMLAMGLRRLRHAGELLTATIAAVLLGLGAALALEISELLTLMILAATAVNMVPRGVSDKVLDSVELINVPLVAAFFCLAAARLDVSLLRAVGILGLVYTAARMVGKSIGAWAGARLTGAEPKVASNIGFGLWPQIGAAIALAILVDQRFGAMGPEGQQLAQTVINLLLFTTVITEVVGPIMTRWALARTGEIPAAKKRS